MTKSSHIPPTPAVEHLPTVFRRIKAGEYRVPPFQREFVWDEKQILELLESVYRGYPIGSALLWKVDKKVFKTVKEQSVGFPLAPETYPASFVLDGVQRLSSLNGVFNRDDVVTDKRLDVHFDLVNERFLHSKDTGTFLATIPLRTVFKPRAFLEEQKRLAAQPDSDLLLDRAISLLTVFQEYLFPIVTIFNKDSNDVVSIFQRINSTGIRLGVVDFMRALTWSDDFDLTKTLLELQRHFENKGFVFNDELLLKALGMVMGLQPLPDVLLALREKSAEELKGGCKTLQIKLDEVMDFFTSSVGLQNSEALPYEAQWLLLFRLRCESVDLEKEASGVTTWLSATSFTEALQGRPDHALSRMIDEISDDIKQGRSIKTVPIHMTTDDIMFKRFLRGKAVTIAYVVCLIGRRVFKELPLLSIPYDKFVPIFSRDEMFAMFGRDLSSPRTIGNVIFLPNHRITPRSDVKEILREMFSDENEGQELLPSQFVDWNFIDAIESCHWKEALTDRAEKIILSTKMGRY